MKTNICVLFIFISLISGCKSKQIFSEKGMKTVDSTSMLEMNSQSFEKSRKIETTSTELIRVNNEYTNSQNVINTHTIKYDTAGSLNPESWKYPISSETFTSSKSDYVNRLSEMESIISNKNDTIDKQKSLITDLRQEVNNKTEENRELKSKTIPQTGFNFRLFFIGVFTGAAICLIIFFRKNIRKYLSFLPRI